MLRKFLAQLQITLTLDEALKSICADTAIGTVEQSETRLTALLKQYPNHRGLTLEAADVYIEVDRFDEAENLLS